MRTVHRGFTLVELLIVIAIISILAFAVILILNPAEILRKARDTQRISDLDTLKTALALYVVSVSSPDLDGTNSSTCGDEGATRKIYISLPTGVTAGTPTSGWTTTFAQAADTAYTKVSGTGWIPVNLDDVTGGSPISKLPIDPKNTTDGTPSGNDLYYRYACNSSTATKSNTFEINAIMESNFFKTGCTGDCNDVSKKDGGDLDTYYEVGTNLGILPNGASF